MKIGSLAKLNPYYGSIRISKHKYFQYQIETKHFNSDFFIISLEWTTRRDHAGIEFLFSIYKLFWVSFCVYDNRHWDFINDSWKEPDICTLGEDSQHIPDEY